jgi:hypothetical protein
MKPKCYLRIRRIRIGKSSSKKLMGFLPGRQDHRPHYERSSCARRAWRHEPGACNACRWAQSRSAPCSWDRSGGAGRGGCSCSGWGPRTRTAHTCRSPSGAPARGASIMHYFWHTLQLKLRIFQHHWTSGRWDIHGGILRHAYLRILW